MIVKEIYDYLDLIAPFNTAEEWDNCGLTVGSFNKDVKKIYIALDVTDEVIEAPTSLVIPEAANREISATVVLKRLLQGLE